MNAILAQAAVAVPMYDGADESGGWSKDQILLSAGTVVATLLTVVAVYLIFRIVRRRAAKLAHHIRSRRRVRKAAKALVAHPYFAAFHPMLQSLVIANTTRRSSDNAVALAEALEAIQHHGVEQAGAAVITHAAGFLKANGQQEFLASLIEDTGPRLRTLLSHADEVPDIRESHTIHDRKTGERLTPKTPFEDDPSAFTRRAKSHI